MRFGDVDARWLVGRDTVGAGAIAFGTATYPPGAAIDRHLHPNAEEVVLVVSGRARHEVGGRVLEWPRRRLLHPEGGAAQPRLPGDEELRIVWAWGGAASVEAAGFVLAPLPD